MNQLEFDRRFANADEQTVRNRLAAGEYKPTHDEMVREWLRIKDTARTSADSASAAATAAEANRIASAAARAQWSAARFAMYAAIIAIVAIAIATKDQILGLIFGNP